MKETDCCILTLWCIMKPTFRTDLQDHYCVFSVFTTFLAYHKHSCILKRMRALCINYIWTFRDSFFSKSLDAWAMTVKLNIHCVKSVRIRSYSGPHFPECGKMWNRITPNMETFHAVISFQTLHKRWSFLSKNFSVNVTKSAVSGKFGGIYWRNP